MLALLSTTTSFAPRSGGLAPIQNVRRFFASLRKEIDYGALRGRPSLAKEAGAWALAGVVPEKTDDGYEVATFAGGCFWGTELHFQRHEGVVATCVGYTQGRSERPTYDEVCSGRSGHTEAVCVCFDPKKTSYGALCELLFKTIDPTLRDRVGADYGTQYRHGIYAHTDAQAAAGTRAVAAEQKRHTKNIVTELLPAKVFWPAEQYHQRYLELGGRFGSGQSKAKGCRDPVRCYG